MSAPTQREAIQRLLRRVDEVRGLESLPVGADFAEGEETARLLATAEGLVDELEKARRRLIETNVQLVSLREVAHTMVSSVGTEETTETVTTYLHKAFGFEDVFLALVHRDDAMLEGTWTRKSGQAYRARMARWHSSSSGAACVVERTSTSWPGRTSSQ